MSNADQQELIKQLQKQLLQERRRNAPTTLYTYVELCHWHLQCRLALQQDPSRTTKGMTTKVRDRPRPERLRLWTDFEGLQQDVLDCLYAAYPGDAPQVSESMNFIKELGRRIASTPLASELASELDLTSVQLYAITHPVRMILLHL